MKSDISVILGDDTGRHPELLLDGVGIDQFIAPIEELENYRTVVGLDKHGAIICVVTHLALGQYIYKSILRAASQAVHKVKQTID